MTVSAIAEDPPVALRVPLMAIAAAFLTVSLFGFGGGVVWARRVAVERRRWISEAEFLDIVSLTQFLPGPNIVGIAVCVGTKLRGGAGALAAIAGFLAILASASRSGWSASSTLTRRCCGISSAGFRRPRPGCSSQRA